MTTAITVHPDKDVEVTGEIVKSESLPNPHVRLFIGANYDGVTIFPREESAMKFLTQMRDTCERLLVEYAPFAPAAEEAPKETSELEF